MRTTAHGRRQVEWHKGSALEPETYAHLLPGATAVVHTIGTLFEKSGYKSALKDGNVPRFVSSIAAGVAGAGVGAGAVGDAAMEGMAIGSMAEVLVGMVVLVHRDPRGLRDLQGRQVLWAMVVDRLRRIHSHLLLPHQ